MHGAQSASQSSQFPVLMALHAKAYPEAKAIYRTSQHPSMQRASGILPTADWGIKMDRSATGVMSLLQT